MKTSKPSSYTGLRLVAQNSNLEAVKTPQARILTQGMDAVAANETTLAPLGGLKRLAGGVALPTLLRTGLDRANPAIHPGTASQSANWLLGGVERGMRMNRVATSAHAPALTIKTALFKPSIPSKQARSEASKATVIYLFTGSNTPYESHV